MNCILVICNVFDDNPGILTYTRALRHWENPGSFLMEGSVSSVPRVSTIWFIKNSNWTYEEVDEKRLIEWGQAFREKYNIHLLVSPEALAASLFTFKGRRRDCYVTETVRFPYLVTRCHSKLGETYNHYDTAKIDGPTGDKQDAGRSRRLDSVQAQHEQSHLQNHLQGFLGKGDSFDVDCVTHVLTMHINWDAIGGTW